MLDAARPGDVRNVNQAVNAFLDFNKGTKVGQVADASMNARADLITLSQSLPGILLDLLHSQADAPGFRVNAEHFNFDGITRVYQLAWMFDPLGPAHLRNVNQALHAGLQLNEGAVVGHAGDRSSRAGSRRKAFFNAFPGIGQKLFVAE